jgi:hypothetical protein
MDFGLEHYQLQHPNRNSIFSAGLFDCIEKSILDFFFALFRGRFIGRNRTVFLPGRHPDEMDTFMVHWVPSQVYYLPNKAKCLRGQKANNPLNKR